MSLPSFLDISSIREQLIELGHDIEIEQVQQLLVELGFAESEKQAVQPTLSPELCGTEKSDSSLVHGEENFISAKSTSTASSSSIGQKGQNETEAEEEDEALDFVWHGKHPDRPGLCVQLPVCDCGNKLGAVDLTAVCPQRWERCALSNTTNSPTTSSNPARKSTSYISTDAMRKMGQSQNATIKFQNPSKQSSLPYPILDADIAQLKTLAPDAFQTGAALKDQPENPFQQTPPQPCTSRIRADTARKKLISRRPEAASACNTTKLNKPKKKADPVSSYQAMKKLWSKDKFLKHGGADKVPRRKSDGFREMFATLHAIEAAKR